VPRDLLAPSSAPAKGRDLLEGRQGSAFVGPLQEPSQPDTRRFNPNYLASPDVGIAALDLGISGARALVNKPALTLGALTAGAVGAVNPDDTFRDAYARSKAAGRADIEAGRTLVRSERLRTPQGEMAAEFVGGLPGIRHIGQAIDWAGQKIEDVAGPETRDTVESVATLATLGRAPRAISGAARAPLTAEQIAARSANGGSAGAAAAATDVSSVTPELRQAIVAQGGKSRAVSQEALSRHVEADTLPVPIRLTAGEALQDPVLLSQERNLRGRHPEMVQRMDETNRALGQNMQALRDTVGERVFTTNPVEHGDTLISAYRAKDALASRAVDVLYNRLRQAAGGDIPVDASAVLNNATKALHQKLLFDHAPPEIMRTLTRLAENNSMTFENFEAMRTNLARIARSGADGNVKAAAGVIRQALEDIPLRAGAEHLKDVANAARAAARRRFQALEADPAYDAAVNGTVPPDRFVQKFIIGAPRDQLAVTMRNLADQRETAAVAILDHLREASRLDPGYNGNFSTAGFSRALEALNPKANLVLDARTIDTLSKLRNVAGYTTFQPRGSFVNNSNTMVASAAKYGAQALEGATNVAFGGIPVGTWAGNAVRSAGTRKLIRSSLQPGAGLVPPKGVKPLLGTEEARRKALADELRR
jgi:hypothetical protein